MMEEFHKIKVDKMKEKGSQHYPEHAAYKEETPVGGAPQNTEQRFITVVEVVAFLKTGFTRADLFTH